MKPRVYVETTIVGHLASRIPSDLVVASQMLLTRQWWNDSRSDFDIFVSELVRAEIMRGDPSAAVERAAVVAPIANVPILDAARTLAATLVSEHALPEKAKVDALHLAICATNGIDYLLTWNCCHLANATRQKNIAQV